MRFDPRFLDDIRARVTISDLVGRTVALKRQGREFAGLSPFNKERTPSFFVNDEKRFYHCFSSGKHGDAFDWLMETEGLSFPEAVEQLAGMAGLPMPARDEAAQRAYERAARAASWLELAQEFFAAELKRARGAEARGYLERRGLTPADWATYEIGYAPDDWSALKDHLIAKGAKDDALVEAGLAARGGEGGERVYDYFRHRVTFAIRDPQGRLAGFGARALAEGERAKYLNSRENEVFHKGRLLYRYREARAALANARGEGAPRGLIVAEGYMDVIALARFGFEHACAPLGTALTEDQLDLLWRAGPEPILCFDGDAAGLRAAHRAIDRALPRLSPGRTLRFAMMPPGQDPDDLLRASGPRAMGEVLAAAKPLIDVLWEREREAESLDTPEARAGLKSRLAAAAARIEDKSVASEYKREVYARCDALFAPAPRAARAFRATGFGRFAPPAGATAETLARKGVSLARARVRDAGALLAALIERPAILEPAAETLAALEFADEEHARLRDALLDWAVAARDVDKSSLHVHLALMGIEDAATRVVSDVNVTAAPVCRADTPDGEATSDWERAAADYMRRTELDAERSALLARMRECREGGDHAGLKRAVRALAALNRRAGSDAD